jgi:hypothetical protein
MIKLYHGSNQKIEAPMTKRLTTEQIQLMKDELTTELAGYLVDDYHYTPEEAIDVLYTSETFERLQNDATGLYYQSPGYVYSFLKNELETARVF